MNYDNKHTFIACQSKLGLN